MTQLEFNLNAVDIYNLDFFKLIFLRQTGRYYYLNSVQYTSGKMAQVSAVEIVNFVENLPITQLNGFNLNLGHEDVYNIEKTQLLAGYEDPEGDNPYKLKIISGFDQDITVFQDGTEIITETEILWDDVKLQVKENSGGSSSYTHNIQFAIADVGSKSYGDVVANITVNVESLVLTPPVAVAPQSLSIGLTLNGDVNTIGNFSAGNSYATVGTIVAYRWFVTTTPEGSDIRVKRDEETSPVMALEVTANSDCLGVAVIELQVTDSYGQTDTDGFSITLTEK